MTGIIRRIKEWRNKRRLRKLFKRVRETQIPFGIYDMKRVGKIFTSAPIQSEEKLKRDRT